MKVIDKNYPAQEDALNIYDFTVQTQLVRNAVSRFEADDQKSQYDMLKEIKVVLKQWLSDWLDNRINFLNFPIIPSNGEVLYASCSWYAIQVLRQMIN